MIADNDASGRRGPGTAQGEIADSAFDTQGGTQVATVSSAICDRSIVGMLNFRVLLTFDTRIGLEMPLNSVLTEDWHQVRGSIG
jgi:hypothetical protein